MTPIVILHVLLFDKELAEIWKKGVRMEGKTRKKQENTKTKEDVEEKQTKNDKRVLG